jgi:hypothetical protein
MLVIGFYRCDFFTYSHPLSGMMLLSQGHRVPVVDSRQGARDLQLCIGCQFRRNGILGYPVLPSSCRCRSTDNMLRKASHDGLDGRHDVIG